MKYEFRCLSETRCHQVLAVVHYGRPVLGVSPPLFLVLMLWVLCEFLLTLGSKGKSDVSVGRVLLHTQTADL